MDINIIRHSLAHVMALVVGKKFNGVKFGIGPNIDNGFYYDFDFNGAEVSEKDLAEIEVEMKKIILEDLEFVKKDITISEAKDLFKEQQYKLELINELAEENQTISIYSVGEFTDLCRGPHVASTKMLRGLGFKLDRINGAYWRGSEKNKMLSRIYALAFESEKELKKYLFNREEALKRDHNKLGRELEYFTTVETIGKGLPILLPRGAKTVQILERFVEDEEEKRGYLLTKTPFMAKSDMYEISGHWQHYKDNMFILDKETTKENATFALRPMTCPFQYMAYLNKARSYKELPMRFNETAKLFRKEASGEMHGLTRMWQFTLSEGHIICTKEQITDEFKEALKLAKFMLDTLGLSEDVSYRFSKRDKKSNKYIGTDADWENSEAKMKDILDELKLNYIEAEGEAAFYGPKLDIQIKNVFGKEDTIITIQLDFAIAEKFKMEFTNREGKKEIPFILHRSSIGCYERTLASLIEKYAGNLPFWLCTPQIGVASVSEKFNSYATKIFESLKDAGLRVKLNISDDGLGTKVNEFRKERTPYTIVVGEKEQTDNTISVKIRGGQQVNDIKLENFITEAINLNKNRGIVLIDKF